MINSSLFQMVGLQHWAKYMSLNKEMRKKNDKAIINMNTTIYDCFQTKIKKNKARKNLSFVAKEKNNEFYNGEKQ